MSGDAASEVEETQGKLSQAPPKNLVALLAMPQKYQRQCQVVREGQKWVGGYMAWRRPCEIQMFPSPK